MSFYRSILATVAAVVIVSPVFADDHATAKHPADHAAATTATVQLGDNSSASSGNSAHSTSQEGAPAEVTKVNINQATVKDLLKVQGLNASKAKAIVKYRKKHGDFKSLDVLSKVRGFTKMKTEDLQKIQDQLSV